MTIDRHEPTSPARAQVPPGGLPREEGPFTIAERCARAFVAAGGGIVVEDQLHAVVGQAISRAGGAQFGSDNRPAWEVIVIREFIKLAAAVLRFGEIDAALRAVPENARRTIRQLVFKRLQPPEHDRIDRAAHVAWLDPERWGLDDALASVTADPLARFVCLAYVVDFMNTQERAIERTQRSVTEVLRTVLRRQSTPTG